MADDRWAQISRIYNDAAALAPVDRAPYLRNACGGDEALRAEIESLLLDDIRANALLQSKDSQRTFMAFTSPVSAGTRFGPYEILSSLGAGGMGEVYRARDERLGRMVAIKVIPSASRGDPEFRERLRREARALSRFSHPNVCALYDVGTEGDRDYFVMELLEGETLAKRLERGPLPIERALEVALQIANALETSHRMGLVHRDLKPANIMVTASGVKLLDFGLVRFAPSGALPSRETISDALTSQGTLLGTVQYMSPEQVEGREADARSDLFSFGAVLYEMITGRRAFTGDTQASLIGAILKDDPPPLLAVQPAPPDLDQLILSCLVKTPEDRWQSAHDLRVELGWIADRLRRPDAALPARRSPRVWMAVAVISAAVAALLIGRELRRTPLERHAIRSMLPPPEDSQFISVGTHAGPAVLSPDGRRVAFLATSSDARLRLWIRSLDSLVTQSLSGTEGASFPFWSADGDQLGFFADRKLKKISIATGAVVTLADVNYGAGGTWNRDGTIVFAPGLNLGLRRISADGGPSAPVTALTASETTHRWPVFLPDGLRFLYTVQGQVKPGRWTTKVGSLDSDQAGGVIEGGDSNAIYANGAIVFARSGTLLAQPVDERTLQSSGNAVQLAENVVHDVALGRAVFSASETGTLIYQIGSAASGSRLVWLDRSGKELDVVEDTCVCVWPRLSPDGRRVAIQLTDAQTGSNDIWTYELAERSRSQLTFDEALEANPEWTPEGSRIVFTSTRRGVRDIHWMDARGNGPQEPLLESDVNKTVTSISPAGVIFAVGFGATGQTMVPENDLWMMTLTGDRKPRALLAAPHNQLFGQISPDGRWLLYQSNESGKAQIYVTSFPALQGKRQISEQDGAILPMWSSTGQEIFYLTQDQSTVFAAALAIQGGTLQVSRRDRVFSAQMVAGRGYPYDVSKDGKRFLVVASPGATTTPLTLVVDWPSELKR